MMRLLAANQHLARHCRGFIRQLLRLRVIRSGKIFPLGFELGFEAGLRSEGAADFLVARPLVVDRRLGRQPPSFGDQLLPWAALALLLLASASSAL